MNLLLSHIYKPRRVLFYIEPTETELSDFYSGKLPETLLKWNGSFGTYDCPGLFKLTENNHSQTLLGIEYRPDDSRINYPDNLKTLILDEGFMIAAFGTDDSPLNEKITEENILHIQKYVSDNPYHKVIKPKAVQNLVQIFTFNNKKRIFINCEKVLPEEFYQFKEPETPIEKQLYNTAYHDYITGHYNWNYILPIISSYGFKGIQDFVFAYFDVKDFNAINILYGHEIANRTLTRIKDHLLNQDWIYYSARCDNDNFLIMLKDMPEEEIREKLSAFFSEISILKEDKHYHIYYRCGVVPMRNCLLLGDTVADAGKLVQRQGNKINETEILFYTDKMNDELDWNKKIKAYLDTAIENDEFLVYLQPKYDTKEEKLHGAEALIRWNYQGKKLLGPGAFIPIFEKDGLIGKIDDIVLKKVCSYYQKWQKEGLPLYPISVNLSRKRMENPELIEHLTSIVDSYNIDHSLIDFELTESAVYDNQDYMVNIISQLKEKGFRISMDDFGTGFSSLSLLTIMPIDTLKIDKSFVDGIGTEKETYKERAVVKHIIKMAEELNLTTLAEGAEAREQVNKLKEFGCEIIQGYYFSKPLPVAEYEERLRQSK